MVYEPFEQFCNGDARCDGTLRDLVRRLAVVEAGAKQQEEFRMETRETFAEMRGHWKGTQTTLRFIAAAITVVGIIAGMILTIAFHSHSEHGSLFSSQVSDSVIAQESGLRPR